MTRYIWQGEVCEVDGAGVLLPGKPCPAWLARSRFAEKVKVVKDGKGKTGKRIPVPQSGGEVTSAGSAQS